MIFLELLFELLELEPHPAIATAAMPTTTVSPNLHNFRMLVLSIVDLILLLL
jgi:hypothetical protein